MRYIFFNLLGPFILTTEIKIDILFFANVAIQLFDVFSINFRVEMLRQKKNLIVKFNEYAHLTLLSKLIFGQRKWKNFMESICQFGKAKVWLVGSNFE